jgi:hypothetical protein
MHPYDCRVGTVIPQATSGQIADILCTCLAATPPP